MRNIGKEQIYFLTIFLITNALNKGMLKKESAEKRKKNSQKGKIHSILKPNKP